MNITATIQARMSSSRLPGKILADLCGKPMLQWQIERIKRSRLIDNVVVATTTSQADDVVESFCLSNNYNCYRGSENDVLRRIASLLRDKNVDLHVECHGDSPLVDAQIIDEFIGFYLKNKNTVDFCSSTLKTTYPPGLEVTVYPAIILIEVDNLVAVNDPMREHVGYNISRFPNRYRLHSLEAPFPLHAPETYLEVDTPEDLDVVRSIFGHFVSQDNCNFGLNEILFFLRKNPDYVKHNRSIERKWKRLRNERDN
jgi:spore coat polysaccharide biosynthesis protein SpsF